MSFCLYLFRPRCSRSLCAPFFLQSSIVSVSRRSTNTPCTHDYKHCICFGYFSLKGQSVKKQSLKAYLCSDEYIFVSTTSAPSCTGESNKHQSSRGRYRGNRYLTTGRNKHGVCEGFCAEAMAQRGGGRKER